MFSARATSSTCSPRSKARRSSWSTLEGLLKTDASALFGRYMIAPVMAAAFERVAVPYNERKPAYLVIDEAAEYFDDSLESLLVAGAQVPARRPVRPPAHGAAAHRRCDRRSRRTRRSRWPAASPTGTPGCWTPTCARPPSSSRRCAKGAKSTEFAAYVRNETPTAVRIEVPFGTMEAAPRMSPEQHRRLVALKWARYSTDPEDVSNEAEHAPDRDDLASTIRDDDIRPSKDWWRFCHSSWCVACQPLRPHRETYRTLTRSRDLLQLAECRRQPSPGPIMRSAGGSEGLFVLSNSGLATTTICSHFSSMACCRPRQFRR